MKALVCQVHGVTYLGSRSMFVSRRENEMRYCPECIKAPDMEAVIERPEEVVSCPDGCEVEYEHWHFQLPRVEMEI